ncbi:MAG: hypothetical protein GWN13_09920 [Phycisphaerae bacterium]|nr:hypothetical protein [Phycisphaerae bacterium]
MATLTIELPDELMQQVERRGISQQRLEKIVLHVVQFYLHEWDEILPDDNEPEWTDGEAFARRMIANNRELFEELARL